MRKKRKLLSTHIIIVAVVLFVMIAVTNLYFGNRIIQIVDQQKAMLSNSELLPENERSSEQQIRRTVYTAFLVRLLVFSVVICVIIYENYRVHKISRSNKQKYLTLFNGTSDAILLLNKQGQFLDCNEAALSMFRLKDREEMKKHNPISLSPEYQPDGTASRDQIIKLIDQFSKVKRSYFNWVHQTVDGHLFYAKVLVNKIEIGGEEIFQGTIRDVSSEKEVEDKLIASNELLNSLINSIPDLIFYKNRDGTYLGCNQAYLSFTGRKKGEVQGKSDEQIHSPELAKRFKNVDSRILETRKSMQTEEWVRYPDGRRAYMSTIKTPLISSDGYILGILGISRDLTENQRIKEEIQEKQEILKETQRIAHIGSWVWNIPKNTLQWSDEIYRIFGLEPHEFEATYDAFLTRVHPDDREKVKNAVNASIEKNHPYNIEHRIVIPDGSEKMVREIGDLQWDDDGNLVSMIGSVLDITDFKIIQRDLEVYQDNLEELVDRRTRELVQAKVEAEQANRMKSAFLANMSHEIRTPMNSILGFIELVLEMEGIPSRGIEYLNTSRTSAMNLLGIINDILDISKLEAGKVEIENENFYFPGLLDEVLGSFSLTAKKKGLDLALSIDDQLKFCFKGDVQRLRQVLFNLLGNAVKFTGKGAVEVSATCGDGEFYIISIRDTGIGMNDKVLDQLFKPFIQADNSTARKYGGTGLGMTISKELIELMGGSIEVRSKVGEGSEFIITLPLIMVECDDNCSYGCQQETRQENVFYGTLSTSPCSVLIAEDLEMNAILVRTRLENKGYRVTVVTDGGLAVSEYQKNPYDMILMDIHMPNIDGLEATREIRAIEKVRGGYIPIIALTASVMESDHHVYLEAGIDDVVGKPILFEDLFEKMKKLLKIYPPFSARLRSRELGQSAKGSDPSGFSCFQKGIIHYGGPKHYFDSVAVFLTEGAVSDLESRTVTPESGEFSHLLEKIKTSAQKLFLDDLNMRILEIEQVLAKSPGNDYSSINEMTGQLIQQITVLRKLIPDSDTIVQMDNLFIDNFDTEQVREKGETIRDLFLRGDLDSSLINDFLQDIRFHVDPELITELKQRVEIYNFKEAAHLLDAIMRALDG